MGVLGRGDGTGGVDGRRERVGEGMELLDPESEGSAACLSKNGAVVTGVPTGEVGALALEGDCKGEVDEGGELPRAKEDAGALVVPSRPSSIVFRLSFLSPSSGPNVLKKPTKFLVFPSRTSFSGFSLSLPNIPHFDDDLAGGCCS